MPIDFPSNPTDGQQYTNPTSGIVYSYSNAISSWSATANSTVGFTGSVGAIGYTGSTSPLTKTLDYTGTLTVSSGTKKWWINRSFLINRAIGYLDTAPTGASLVLRINKNGSNAGLFTVGSGNSSFTSSMSLNVVQGDYLTVDVVQVGSTVAGSDLSLMFEYS